MLEILISNKSSQLVCKGFPWVYKKDIPKWNSSFDIAEQGELCRIIDNSGRFIATAYFNPKSFISARILSTNPKEKIDEEFFFKRISHAISKRDKIFSERYFRAVYSESDHLPGLLIDLYGKYAVVQSHSAGMGLLQKYWLPALIKATSVEGVFLDSGSKHNAIENTGNNAGVIFGTIPELIEVKENEITYYADLFKGQKTGWFFDQRANRKFLADLCKGKSVIDLYTHSGGFGLLAAKNGAANTLLVDRSELALELAKKAIAKNDIKNCTTEKADIFEYLDEKTEKYDVVNADPPAFIKTRNDLNAGLKGYEKLVKKCIPLVAERGIFAISSCSYFARPDIFQQTVESAITKTGRSFTQLKRSAADKDHPIHPMLDETNYLKFLVYKLD